MQTFRLGKIWNVVRLLGRGGFGEVYEVESDGESRALKVIRNAEGAWREVLVNDIPEGPFAIPILEAGEQDGNGLLLMPLAERSLRDAMNEGAFDESSALAVISEIASGLEAMDEAGVIHRDIKPENILLHDGRWKLTDFGEARYAEATTALDTRKLSMTPEYAAPERWWGERATVRSDVYSLGVIGFELLAGERPFPGPREELREQHLNWPAPELTGVSVSAAALVRLCLAKQHEARPRPAELRRRLQSLVQPVVRPGLDALVAAGAAIAETMATESLAESRHRQRVVRFDNLFNDAVPILRDHATRFAQTMVDVSLVGKDLEDPNFLAAVELGSGRLTIQHPRAVDVDVWGDSTPVFEVVACSAIQLHAYQQDAYSLRSRAHSLWFGDLHSKGDFDWFEVAFYRGSHQRDEESPFAWDLDVRLARWLLNLETGPDLARPVRPFNYESLGPAIAEWAGWLAEASAGPLQRTAMPEEYSSGSHREVGQDHAVRVPPIRG